MRRIFRDKLVELVRGEEGVALVVTLAVFFFMYLIIAGIYAVGTQVRERIHLQNACDAAAYSAAVVQADTLSRIATINRAMSWTYVQMTRRQMDYIVYKWLKHAYDHFVLDRGVAETWHAGSPIVCPLGHGTHPNGWFIGADSLMDRIKLNGRASCAHYDHEIGDALQYFNSHYMNAGRNRKTFYDVLGHVNFGQLKTQIETDKDTIDRMSEEERNLAKDLPERAETIAEGIVDANLDALGYDDLQRKVVWQSPNPLVEENAESGYLRNLQNNDGDELRFARFGGAVANTIRGLFETGINSWFVHSAAGEGLQRLYRQTSALQAEWEWWSAKWSCYYVPPTQVSPGYWVHAHVDYPGVCPHPGCVDTCKRSGKWFKAKLRAGDIHDSHYDGALARPLVMRPNFFGKDGTIVVGIVCENRNPWLSVLGTISGGIFSAFDPYCKKTVVFASAKAGYRTYDEGMSRGRNYQIDWKNEKEWNLYTSDWDAVLMPVRMAKTMATSGSWSAAAGNFLGEWVEQLGVKGGEMRAGGNDVPDTSVLDELFEMDGRLNSRRWYASRAKSGSHKRGLIQARWRVGRQGRTPDWDLLTDRMFH